MKYTLNNDNFEVVGKQYLQGVGGYDGTNPTESDDLAKIINGNTEANLSKLASPYWIEQGFLEQPVAPHFRTPVVFYYTSNGVSALRSEVRPIEIWRCNRLIDISEASIYVKMLGTTAVSGTAGAYLPAGLTLSPNGFLLIWEDDLNRYELLIDGVNTQPKITLKSDSAIIPITYSELVELRDLSKLIPGQQYRIIDYTTTTIQADTQSAGHQFDIIVTADSKNTLNESARAYVEQFNIDNYMDAYSITWPDSMAYQGTHVHKNKTYHMYEGGGLYVLIDFNDIEYLERDVNDDDEMWDEYPYQVIPSYYRIDEGEWVVGDNQETISFKHPIVGDYFKDSKLDAWQIWYSLDNDTERFAWADAENGKGVIYRMIDEWNNECPYDFKNIQFKHPSDPATYPGYYYTFSTVISGTVTDHSFIQGRCYSNTMECAASSKQWLNNNVFLNTSNNSNCHSNSFGNNCNSNSFGNNCHSNSFGNNCNSNSFGSNCYSNSFRNDCLNNSFGNDYHYNSFGSNCFSNFFGSNCFNNSFGSDCISNSFGNNCYYNSFGIYCRNISFGNNCYYNSFGNNCYSNSFGNNCYSNSFGNNCYSNSFGKNYYFNSFGNGCYYNSFRVSADKTSTLKDFVYNNHFDDGCGYNVIWNSATTSSSVQLRNINVNRGVVGKVNSYNMINVTALNQNYELQVANNSAGEIKVYCVADFDKQITTTLNTEV